MSEYTTRPIVRSVEHASVDSSLASAGAVALGAALEEMLEQLATPVATASAAAIERTWPVPAGRIEAHATKLVAAEVAIENTHGTVESVFQALAAQPLVVDPDAIRPHVAALVASGPVASHLAPAGLALLQAAKRSHLDILSGAVVAACRQASIDIGFDQVTTEPARSGDGFRLVATDAAGRCLVSEVDVRPDNEVSLATEVVGVSDGSCHGILDAFDAAVERAGVRSAPPTRTFTGGVCELEYARQLLRERVATPKPGHGPTRDRAARPRRRSAIPLTPRTRNRA